ncbi:cytochrome c oxidase subunit II [Gracilibacillus xinjiangensis]|uniref:Cytochrome c oxidase subunit 2 n=1 Tax=Gracilibacillus xinjiangensis TaxID=1193282 RepID=A0ABV8X054_9BACI
MKEWMGKIRNLSLFTLMLLLLSACGKDNLTALVPKGYGAEESLRVIIITITVMIVVFVVVMAIFVYVLMKFRQKKGQENMIPKQTEGNKTLEIVWTVIPILLLIIIAVPTIAVTYNLADETEKEDSININVTGKQFWWHFEYPEEEIQTSQDLYIPVGQKVYLNMLSSDVIHSFWVPALSGKMDVNPDNENTMFIEAYEEGVYWGKCAEFCGDSHSLMDFKIVVVSQEEYDQWVADMQNVDPEFVPESTTAQEGKALFEDSCLSCHAVGNTPSVGPNLSNFGDRTMIAGVLEHSEEELVEWILDPASKKPGNGMLDAPYLQDDSVSEEDAEKIAEYLLQLKASEINPDSAE